MTNRTHLSLTLFVVCWMLFASIAPAQQPPLSAPDNDFILRASAAEIEGILLRHGLTEIGRLESAPPGEEVCLVRAPDSVSPAKLIADLVTQEPAVDAVEEVFMTELPETHGLSQPAPSISEILGALGDTSTVFFGKDSLGNDRAVWAGYVQQQADYLVQASLARTVEQGDGAVVAIIDTGIDPTHPLFDGHLLPGYDFLQDQAGVASEWNLLDESSIAILGESSIAILGGEDVVTINESSIAILGTNQVSELDPALIPEAFGHGTMVAGIVHLVAPEAKIMPLRVFDGQGQASLFDIVRAIYYAVDQGATVIHMSFSLELASPELIAAIDYADQLGVTIVASVGNEGLETMVFPAGLCNVFGVAATDLADYVSAFSNLGNSLVKLAAPGEDIVTAYPGGGWAGASGTSFAAPWVSGGIALLAAAKGDGAAGSVGFAQINDAFLGSDPAFGSGAGLIGHGRLAIKTALDNLSQEPSTGGNGCSGPGSGITALLNPVADTTNQQDGPGANRNKGHHHELKAKADENKARHSFLHFDLSDLATTVTVTSAKLKLFVTKEKPGITVNIHRLTRAWSEGTGHDGTGVDWYYADEPVAWTTPGGDFSPVVFGTLIPDTKNTTLEVDVTDLVQAWVDGSYANEGFLLAATGAKGEVKFGSRENAGKEPLLEIAY